MHTSVKSADLLQESLKVTKQQRSQNSDLNFEEAKNVDRNVTAMLAKSRKVSKNKTKGKKISPLTEDELTQLVY